MSCPKCPYEGTGDDVFLSETADLRSHYSAFHLRYAPYWCQYCDEGYSAREKLRFHIEIEHNESTFRSNCEPQLKKETELNRLFGKPSSSRLLVSAEPSNLETNGNASAPPLNQIEQSQFANSQPESTNISYQLVPTSANEDDRLQDNFTASSNLLTNDCANGSNGISKHASKCLRVSAGININTFQIPLSQSELPETTPAKQLKTKAASNAKRKQTRSRNTSAKKRRSAPETKLTVTADNSQQLTPSDCRRENSEFDTDNHTYDDGLTDVQLTSTDVENDRNTNQVESRQSEKAVPHTIGVLPTLTVTTTSDNLNTTSPEHSEAEVTSQQLLKSLGYQQIVEPTICETPTTKHIKSEHQLQRNNNMEILEAAQAKLASASQTPTCMLEALGDGKAGCRVFYAQNGPATTDDFVEAKAAVERSMKVALTKLVPASAVGQTPEQQLKTLIRQGVAVFLRHLFSPLPKPTLWGFTPKPTPDTVTDFCQLWQCQPRPLSEALQATLTTIVDTMDSEVSLATMASVTASSMVLIKKTYQSLQSYHLKQNKKNESRHQNINESSI